MEIKDLAPVATVALAGIAAYTRHAIQMAVLKSQMKTTTDTQDEIRALVVDIRDRVIRMEQDVSHLNKTPQKT
jgi:hypothetical protein